MNLLDKLYTEWAWRSKSGLPNIKNPEDKAILDSLIKEMTLEEEPLLFEGSDSYDEQITIKLVRDGIMEEGGIIPPSTGNYKFNGANGGNFTEQVSTSDLKIWRALWSVKPNTAKGESDNLGVGKGEISLYWLYNYNKNSSIEVSEGRAGDDPDLKFNGVGVEVKAYSSGTAAISLGRFSADKLNLQLLSVAFGLNTLTKVLNPKSEAKVINPTNFTGKELLPVFQAVSQFSSLDNLGDLAQNYSVFKTIKDNVDFLVKELGGVTDNIQASKAMATKILEAKLERKPGFGNYLVNVSSQGAMHWWNIDISKIRQSEALLSSFSVNQSKIKLNFSKVLS
tara:strand:+ start:30 stop:1043 length:1014 start_codon:yes stop_codon:yes gene_type:complete